MKNAVEHLADYAAYHRDRRNIATHGVGIPLIVFAVLELASRPRVRVGECGLSISPATLLFLAANGFYLKLDRPLGVAMLAATAPMLALGDRASRASKKRWAGLGLGAFGLGWTLQFIGHAFEGKKPAFVDDVMGLAIGPLFVAAEAAFALGLRPELAAAIEERVGPTHIRVRAA